MSAQLCGCDPEAAHICRRHLEEARNAPNDGVHVDDVSDHEFARCECEECQREGSFDSCAICCARRRGVRLPRATGHRATSEPRVQRFIEQLDADGMVHLVSPLDESLVDAHRLVDQLRGTLTEVAHRAEAVQTAEQANRHALVIAYAQVAEFQRDIRRIGSALATFYRAPLSMSSVQPLLTLAEELNPELRNDPRRI